jgi:hypothetical protein
VVAQAVQEFAKEQIGLTSVMALIHMVKPAGTLEMSVKLA